MYPISNAVKALFDAEQKQILRITFDSVRVFKKMSIYRDGNTLVYRTYNGQDISLYSGATEVFSSGNSQTVILYNGDDMVYSSAENPPPVHVTITDAEVPHGAFSIDRYSCNGNKLEIGTAIASELTLKLNNYDKRYNGIRFEGAELFVEIGIADWSQDEPTITYIPCGYFTPDTQPRTLDTITISALDRMMRFDKEVNAEALTFPMTVATLIGSACTLCNVPFSQDISTLPNSSFSIAELPETVQKMTYRNLIQWCAGIMGTNAWIDWSGSLQFSWYGEETGYTTTTANRFNSDMYEDDIAITGVTYTNTQGTTIVVGVSDYTIDLTGNYLAASGISEIMSGINTAINGFTYRPFSATVINAPYLWPMDSITFTDVDGNDHIGILTNVNFNMSTTVLKGKGETAQTNLGASPNGLTNEQAFLVEKAKQSAIDDMDESLTQEDIFNRLTDNGQLQGLYMLGGQLYINASYLQTGELNAAIVRIMNLSADDIASGMIHSADYQTVVIAKIYPSSSLYPSDATYANNGERVIRGFAIDFSDGQILGGFYSEQITDIQSDVSDIQSDVSGLESDVSGLESDVSGMQSTISSLQSDVSDLQDAIAALQSALVYPKAVPSGQQSFSAPLNMTSRMNNEILADDSDQINDEASADDTVEEDE